MEETLTPDGVINPDLAQETGTNYEIGSQWKLFNKKLQLNITLYQMDIKNLLVAERVGDDQYVGKNAGQTKHRGIEVDLNVTMKLFKTFTLTRFFNYSFSDHTFVDFVDGDNDFSGNALTGVPEHRIVTGMQLQHSNGLYWNTTYTHMGIIPMTDDNTIRSNTYNLVTSKLGYNKQISDRFSLGADFGINNLFNTHYAQSVLINATGFGGNAPRYYYPGPERNFYGSLGLKYQL